MLGSQSRAAARQCPKKVGHACPQMGRRRAEQEGHCGGMGVGYSLQRPHCAHPSDPRLQALLPGRFPVGASLALQAPVLWSTARELLCPGPLGSAP